MRTLNLVILGATGLTLLLAVLLHISLGVVLLMNCIFSYKRPIRLSKFFFGLIATFTVIACSSYFLLLLKFSKGRYWLVNKLNSEPIFVAIKMTLDHYFSGHITLYDVVKDVFVNVLSPPMNLYFSEMSIHFLFEFLKQINILVVNKKHDVYFENTIQHYAYLVSGIQEWEVLPTKMALGNSIPYAMDFGSLNILISQSLFRFLFALIFNPNLIFVILFALLTFSMCLFVIMVIKAQMVFKQAQSKKPACCPFCVSLSIFALITTFLAILMGIALIDDLVVIMLGLDDNFTFSDYFLQQVEGIKAQLTNMAVFDPVETGVDSEGGKVFSHPYVELDPNLFKHFMHAMNDVCPTFGKYDYAQTLPSRSSDFFMFTHKLLTADLLQCFCKPYYTLYVNATDKEKKAFADAVSFGYWWYSILMTSIECDPDNLFVKGLLNSVFYITDKVTLALLS